MIMTEATPQDMHRYEVEYSGPGSSPRQETVTALYWQAGNDVRGDDKRFIYFKDWRHRTVLAVKAELVVSLRIVELAKG
jgi:hypothetical protein